MYLKIGSRASKLALAQSHEIGRFLQSVDSSIRYEIVPFSTKGDKILDKPLHEIGQKACSPKKSKTPCEAKDRSCRPFSQRSS